jgi:hypothetical protein
MANGMRNRPLRIFGAAKHWLPQLHRNSAAIATSALAKCWLAARRIWMDVSVYLPEKITQMKKNGTVPE